MSDFVAIIIGRAERCGQTFADTWADRPDRVRIYRDRFGAGWVGTETDEIRYYDSGSCLHHATDATWPGAMCVGDARVFPDGTTWDVVDPADDWPDYDVHCEHCGDLIHAGGES